MDRFDAMRVFTRIVERASFTKAADDLGLPRSSVTDAVKGLEARLGVRLLARTTRQVAPTLDGQAYYRRCVALIADLEDSESAFAGKKPSGLVRIDVHGTQARHFLLPDLPRFLETYPGISLHIAEVHQALDMLREGFDCILRAGRLTDTHTPLIRRKLAELKCGAFASPAYIARFGVPRTLDDLDKHRIIGLFAPDAAIISPFVFLERGSAEREITPPSVVTVTGAETNVACACLGLGLIQVPRYRVAPEVAAGTLVEVLADYPSAPLPVHVLYSHARQLSPRVRVVIEWMAERFRIVTNG
jgi:DNA-binding transcriptional LysR family regulator